MSISKIYADTQVCTWHLNNLGISYTKASIDSSDVALFHCPYPYVGSIKSTFEQNVSLALKRCKTVVVLLSELHEETVDFCLRFKNPKIIFFTCGIVEDLKTTPWMDWFITSTELYQKTSILDELDPYTVKPKYFDILLGQPKPHRSYIHNYITKNNFNDKVIMTYMDWKGSGLLNMSDSQWLWEPDIEGVTEDTRWTVSLVKYRDHDIRISQIVPLTIYNQTAYSIIAETNFNNHYSFYTEKTVKPILAQRLFLVFAGKHYLKNLRSFGFRTFDGIIDESYDTVDDLNLRYQLVCKQLQYLLAVPQQEIFEKIKPITEHNKQLMLTHDWHSKFQRELRSALVL